MQEGKDHCAADMIFPTIRAYINRAKAFQNNANMTGVYCMDSNIIFKVMSQNYGREGSVAELETESKDFCVFKHKFVNTLSPLCTFGLFTPKYRLLDHLIEDSSNSGSVPALDTFLSEQYDSSFIAAYRHTSKRSAMRIYEIVFGLDRIQINAS